MIRGVSTKDVYRNDKRCEHKRCLFDTKSCYNIFKKILTNPGKDSEMAWQVVNRNVIVPQKHKMVGQTYNH